MRWLQSALHQRQTRIQTLRLASGSAAEREVALALLLQESEVNPALLSKMLRSERQGERLLAAVALHRKGDAVGIETLRQAMQWLPPNCPELVAELANAWRMLDPLEVLPVLLEIWYRLPESAEARPAFACICAAWQAWHDPRISQALLSRAPAMPDLFIDTVRAQGREAIPQVAALLNSPEIERRLLSLRACKEAGLRFSPPEAILLLAPLLRDPDLKIRGSAPSALETLAGAMEAAHAILDLLSKGYATREAVQLLARIQPVGYQECLFAIVRRFDLQTSPDETTDTIEAVSSAITVLTESHVSSEQWLPTFQSLLQRELPIPILLALNRAFRNLPSPDQAANLCYRACLPLLASRFRSVRKEAVSSLPECGFALTDKEATWLVSSGTTSDPAFLYHRARHQRTSLKNIGYSFQWALEREAQSKQNRSAPAKNSAKKFADLLLDLLNHILDELAVSSDPDNFRVMLAQAEEILMRLLSDSIPQEMERCKPLLRALRTTKIGQWQSPEHTHSGEVAWLVRYRAAHNLIASLGMAAFPLFASALYDPAPEVQATAIIVLGEMGEPRALPLLHSFVIEADATTFARQTSRASQTQHDSFTVHLSHLACEAISEIKHANPQIKTLLRPSSAVSSAPDVLLRPVVKQSRQNVGQLLRPSHEDASLALPEGEFLAKRAD